ncbi:MAG: class I SAM-dependent methyltransferase [Actinomycetota bacterium]|nr:class I SAM-dependent methyltransferase [Actinomycetota bacterium]
MQARDWDERYAATEIVWGVDPNQFVARECAALAPGRALDLACGEGRNTIWLAARGWQATGVDFSAVAIEKAGSLAAAQEVAVEWQVGDLLEWEPTPRAYDLVVLAYLQVVAADRAVIWPRAAGAVAPGGTFVLVGHDRRNLTDGYGGPSNPDVLYTAADVVPHLDGFGVRYAGEVERTVATGEVAIDCLVRAARAPGSH